MFFDKLCSISDVQYTKVWWVSKRSKVSLYTSIPCNYEQSKTYMRQLEYAKNVDVPKYQVVIWINYNLVRENQVIELIDPILWSMWEYIVSGLNATKSVWWWIDCITLECTELKWR
jgi:hypothetical protein